jgi:hypothetical protein
MARKQEIDAQLEALDKITLGARNTNSAKKARGAVLSRAKVNR